MGARICEDPTKERQLTQVEVAQRFKIPVTNIYHGKKEEEKQRFAVLKREQRRRKHQQKRCCLRYIIL